MPLTVAEVEVPAPQHGQVLVQVHCAGICGTQLGEINGARGEDKYLPHLLGHEGAGTVKAVGPGIKFIRPGHYVVMHWRPGLGVRADFPRYIWGDKTVGGGLVTTFNEYALVSENRLTPISSNIPREVAALMGCAVTTGLGLIDNEAQLKIGQSIAVIGCGGVGTSVILGAAMVSARPIIGIDNKEYKLNMAEKYGATHTINSTQLDITNNVRKIVGSQGVDVVVECTGIAPLIELAYRLTGRQGRTIMVGIPRFDDSVTFADIQKDFLDGKALITCQGGHVNPTVDIPRYLALYQTGALNLDEMVTHRFPLAQINEALTRTANGECGRVVVEMP
jgi:S-(hydroxymethyl)glutathione dehydrogenase/alcohol dehydrogenase